MSELNLNQSPLPAAHFILWNMKQSELDRHVIRPLNWWAPVVREALDNYLKKEQLYDESNEWRVKWFNYYSQAKYWLKKALPHQTTRENKLNEFCLLLSKNGHIIIEPPGKLRANGPDFISFYFPNRDPSSHLPILAPTNQHTINDNNFPTDHLSGCHLSIEKPSTTHGEYSAPTNPSNTRTIKPYHLSESKWHVLTQALQQQAIIECVYDFEKMHLEPPTLNSFRH